ncbi:DinB family protein [Granulicella arctica]|uniref:DinB family protein n=1 Tax=Granulicella arctica TaxID=940613 RepID=UPI0021E0F3F0|nr:DinB family protein [Granulicella arctica]
MHPILDKLQNEIRDSLSGLSAEQTQLRPLTDPAKWSIQQVMEHLLLTYRSSCAVVEGRVAKGTPTKASPDMRQRVAQFAVFQCGYFPTGRRAPAMVTPPDAGEAVAGEVLAVRAAELLERFDRLTAEMEGLFGRKRAISHGVLGPLGAQQWRRFQLMHGQHHLRQVCAIRAAHGLSRGSDRQG